MKRYLLLALPALFLATGCSTLTQGVETPVRQAETAELNSLQRVFQNLAQGNFTAEYDLSYAGAARDYTQHTYYTDYAIETDGYFGFNAVAQGDGLIFPYTYEGANQDRHVESQAPSIDSFTGMRYTDITDFRTTFKDIDLDALPAQADEDGWYTYQFGVSEANDAIMREMCMLYTEGSSNPTSLRFRAVGNALQSEGVGLVYEGGYKDTVSATFTQVGTTELSLVRAFLDEGGTAKDYVSDRFVAFMLPYLASTNYTVEVDLSQVQSSGISSPKYTKLFTDEAEFSYVDDITEGSGYVQYMNTVVGYKVDDNSDVVFGAIAAADASGTAMTDLWAQEIGQSFLDLTASSLMGYMTEEDGETVYHLNNTQLISAIANLSNVGYDDTFHVDEILITIDDWDSHSFTVEFPYETLTTSQQLGSAFVTFKDLNSTVNTPVDRLLYEGDDAATQDKAEFGQALELFKTGRYAQYGLGQLYMSETVYAPEYYYASYANQSYGGSDYGFLLEDGQVVDIRIDGTGEVSVGNAADIVLPGTGEYYGASDDLSYLSHPTFSDQTEAVRAAMYDLDNYILFDDYGLPMWVNTDPTFNAWVADYFSIFNYGGQALTPYALGFRTSLQGDDPSTKMNKLTAYLYLSDPSGNMMMTSFSYFDLGHAQVAELEEYLSQAQA